MILDSTLAVGFRSTTITNFRCSASFLLTKAHRPWCSTPYLSPTPKFLSKTFRSAAAAAASDLPEINGKSSYHPFEEIGETVLGDTADATLTAAELTRTLIEVNSKATLMFSGLVDDQIQENVFWPDLPYLTDEHGNIYFEVNDDEDILRTLTTENNYVQVIIGLDTKEMLEEMELGSDIDFGFEEITGEDSEDDEEYEDEDEEEDDDDGVGEEEWVDILEDELGSDGHLGDWAKLETMRSSHPMSFAKKMSEVVSDEPMDWMDQPPAGLAIQGHLQPSFIEEGFVMRKHMADHQPSNDDRNLVDKVVDSNSKDLHINGHDHNSDSRYSSKDGSLSEEVEKDETQTTGSSFYKLEMVKIQLVSPQGNQIPVELKDFQKAQPDAIAHTAEKIISRLKAGGEKIAQALKSLCWRVKSIQVEEAMIIGVDSLGVDLRVCSGTQVQTLRFSFAAKATSEYSAERQLHELMFPRSHNKLQKRPEASPKEC